MILCLDVGNTHIYGGVYSNNKLQLQFRYPSATPSTSDQLGIFFKTVLRENNLEPKQVNKIVICSVVPSLNYSLRSALLKYFSLEPIFLQNENVPIRVAYDNPTEVGADRLSSAIAATHKYPNENLIIIDLGTATTFDAVAADCTFLGGVIIPGIYISMKALYENTAKLSPVNIIKPAKIIGQSTITNIQSGLYYSHLGAIQTIVGRMTQEAFVDKPPLIIGTGGFASLFEDENIFNVIIPELVLEGLALTAEAR